MNDSCVFFASITQRGERYRKTLLKQQMTHPARRELSSLVRPQPDVSLSACARAAAAALDLTLALGPFDTFPEIMCEWGVRASDSTHLENEFDAPVGMIFS